MIIGRLVECIVVIIQIHVVHLGREHDAEPALVDFDGAHVRSREWVALQHVDLRQVLQQLPLA